MNKRKKENQKKDISAKIKPFLLKRRVEMSLGKQETFQIRLVVLLIPLILLDVSVATRKAQGHVYLCK
jgi:hypothetical protein